MSCCTIAIDGRTATVSNNTLICCIFLNSSEMIHFEYGENKIKFIATISRWYVYVTFEPSRMDSLDFVSVKSSLQSCLVSDANVPLSQLLFIRFFLISSRADITLSLSDAREFACRRSVFNMSDKY